MPVAAQTSHVFSAFRVIIIREAYALLALVTLVIATSVSRVMYAISVLQNTSCPRMALLA